MSLGYNENRELWTKRIAAYKESGLSQIQWCKQNEVSISAFRSWLKKVKQVIDNSTEQDTFVFASLDVPGNSSSKGIILEIGPVRIHLNNDFDEPLLLKAIKTLQHL